MEKAPTRNLNMKALVGAFNQEKAFSVIVKTDGSFYSATLLLLQYTTPITIYSSIQSKVDI